MIGIYRIYHSESGKSYIGKSVNIQRRVKSHFQEKVDTYIHRAINKDRDAFAWEVLEICSEQNLDTRECHWIAALDCFAPNGFNLTSGGEGHRHSVGTRQKMSESHKNKKFSDTHRENLSNSLKGRKLSAEQCKRMSEAFSGEGNPFYGKTQTLEACAKIAKASTGRECPPEVRAKMSKAHTGKKHPPEVRAKISSSKQGEKNPMYGKPCTRKRPEYEYSKWVFFLLPTNMDTKEKRKEFFKAFPNVPKWTLYEWFRKWQRELENLT